MVFFSQNITSKYLSLAVILFLLCGLNYQAHAKDIAIQETSSLPTNSVITPSDSLLYGVPSDFVEDLKERTFTYFWEVVDTETWQTDDRYPSRSFTSIAATGFALPAYIIGIHNEYISREDGADRVYNVLEWVWNAPQGTDSEGKTGHRGFFYHFLNYETGTRYQQVELSTIDTALLMAGILTAQSYFDGNNSVESGIRALADSLYRRVEWNWAMNGNSTMSMGWHPERGFIDSQWEGYDESIILMVLGLGSPTHPIPDESWDVWTSTNTWTDFYGYEHINFGPLFGHQYSHMFIDFREIQDEYMRDMGIDYFENSRRATLSNRAYCKDNPGEFKGYSEHIWGLTASDGPANVTKNIDGQAINFHTYTARGTASGYLVDDGTIAPTAAGGSIPFAPEETLNALYTMKETFGEKLYAEYGFLDSFNLTYDENGWYNPDYIGIDQGPIIIQLENYQTELIWNILKENKYIKKGLKKAGFKGGWLNDKNEY
ncbi:glucoamylase family protein [Rhodohalobacter sp.]|uniref:glucoamylase family protein n=1 Tax=Rhodohalobacter sp. TaxID=1974210 RepID=UPI002ACD5C9B|nr:glucoamylase family protein [Rhodohalobacter sp.]MDZ7757308.1 glucoamylase family protein [Rhodohalobacter sp.]